MMDNLSRQKGENYRQELQRNGSYNNKPPMVSWHNSVPAWEKQFCAQIGCVSWRNFLEMKKYMHLYNNVIQWNDSAGEEAFNNAKSRFYAKINNLPCDISLPNKNAYIDEIDWNSHIDPELISDLESEPDETEHQQEVSNGNLILPNHPVVCTGWGDEEEVKDQGNAINSGWSDNVVNNDSNWGNNANAKDGWGGCVNNSWEAGNNYQMSRYKTSRFHGNDYQRDYGPRNGKWRNTENNHVSKQWKMVNSCQPMNQGRRRNTMNWEKPVS